MLLLGNFFWYRFIRARVPRDLPFNLHLISLIVICFIILIYAKTLLWKKPYQQDVNNVSFIYSSLYKVINILDDNFKYYIKIKGPLQYFINKINNFPSIIYPVICLSKHVPRFILRLLFFRDTFYVGQLCYIYKGVWLLLMPLIITYFLYSLNKIKKERIADVEEKIELRDQNFLGPIIPVEQFMNLQACAIISGKPALRYELVLNYDYTMTLVKKYNIQKGFQINTKPIYAAQQEILKKILDISKLQYLIQTFDVKYAFIQFITKMLYIIGWSYILLISGPYFHLLPLESSFVSHFQTIIEPFSGTKIW